MNDFDIEKIGRRIAKARKILNMTQMELADKLYVSFQAVSNWERGQSIPDLERMARLCEVLNLTFDELLGNNHITQQVNKLSSTEKNNEIYMRELVDTAPFLKPQEIEAYINKLKDFPLDQIIQLAPFIKENTLGFLVEKAILQEMIMPEYFHQLAPFMNKNQFNKLIRHYLKEGEEFTNYEELIPFLEDETLLEILQ